MTPRSSDNPEPQRRYLGLVIGAVVVLLILASVIAYIDVSLTAVAP